MALDEGLLRQARDARDHLAAKQRGPEPPELPDKFLVASVLGILGPLAGALAASLAAAVAGPDPLYNASGPAYRGYVAFATFLVAWGALSFRMIRLDGTPRSEAIFLSIAAAAWTTMPWLLPLLAILNGLNAPA